MSRLKVHKLKKDKVSLFKEWSLRLSTEFAEEAKLAIIEENVTHEHFGLIEIAGDSYLVSNMEGDNILPPNLERWVNVEHKKILAECAESVVPIEILIDIKT